MALMTALLLALARTGTVDGNILDVPSVAGTQYKQTKQPGIGSENYNRK